MKIKKRQKHYINLVYLFILGLFGALYTSAYTVPEGQHAVIFYGKRPIQTASNTPKVKFPGLHFRNPLLPHPRFYDSRQQHLQLHLDPITVHNFDNSQIELSVLYHITNPALYFAWIDEHQSPADNAIEIYLNTYLNQHIKSTFHSSLEKTTDLPQAQNSEKMLVTSYNESINTFLKEITAPLGIKVTESYITQLHLSEATRMQLFERMKKNYEQVNAEYRRQGEITAAKTRAQTLHQTTELINTAREQAAKLRNQADVMTTELINTAYQKHPTFAKFYQNLITYQRSLVSSSPTLIVFQIDKFPNSKTLH